MVVYCKYSYIHNPTNRYIHVRLTKPHSHVWFFDYHLIKGIILKAMLIVHRFFTNFPKNSVHSQIWRYKNWFIRKVPLRHSFIVVPREIVGLRLPHSVSPVAMSVGQRQPSDYSDSGSGNNCINCRKLSTVPDTTITRKMPEVKPFQRLPDNVKPKHYKLSLVPDLKSFTFRGDVSIQIEVGLSICRFLFKNHPNFVK